MTVNIVLSEALMEEMDIICDRLSRRGAETTLESAADAWGPISAARRSNDIELLRAFDACYSKEFKPKYIAIAVKVLRGQMLAHEVANMTTDSMNAFRQVGKAIMRYNDRAATPHPVTIELEHKLRALALTNSSNINAISSIISERGITDPDQIMGLVAYMGDSIPLLEDGVI